MKILVVDDEVDIQELFKQKFRKEIRENEMDFAFALSGEEALRFLSEKNHEAILILSDINMPGMSGLDLLEQIKINHKGPPSPLVMMITAYGDEENYRRAISLGANAFLTKPLEFSLLKEKLKKIQHG